MSKTDFRSRPTREYTFFLYDPEGDGLMFFRTAEARDAHIPGVIDAYLGDGWSEEVEGVCSGQVTHIATQTNREERPDDVDEEGIAGDGSYWDGDAQWRCDYALTLLAELPAQVNQS